MYIFIIVTSSLWMVLFIMQCCLFLVTLFFLKFILSDNNVNHTILLVLFGMFFFTLLLSASCAFIFQVCLLNSLFIHSDKLFLWIGMFSPFTFNIIIDLDVFKSTILMFFCSLSCLWYIFSCLLFRDNISILSLS